MAVVILRPDTFGGTPEHPYARRWRLIPKNRALNVMINQFLMTDPIKEPHGHPSFSLSLVLRGRYFEEEGDRVRERRPWSFKFRGPWSFHRITMKPGESSLSLFIQGPEFWTWGFRCGDGRVLSSEEYFGKNGNGCNA